MTVEKVWYKLEDYTEEQRSNTLVEQGTGNSFVTAKVDDGLLLDGNGSAKYESDAWIWDVFSTEGGVNSTVDTENSTAVYISGSVSYSRVVTEGSSYGGTTSYTLDAGPFTGYGSSFTLYRDDIATYRNDVLLDYTAYPVIDLTASPKKINHIKISSIDAGSYDCIQANMSMRFVLIHEDNSITTCPVFTCTEDTLRPKSGGSKTWSDLNFILSNTLPVKQIKINCTGPRYYFTSSGGGHEGYTFLTHTDVTFYESIVNKSIFINLTGNDVIPSKIYLNTTLETSNSIPRFKLYDEDDNETEFINHKTLSDYTLLKAPKKMEIELIPPSNNDELVLQLNGDNWYTMPTHGYGISWKEYAHAAYVTPSEDYDSDNEPKILDYQLILYEADE